MSERGETEYKHPLVQQAQTYHDNSGKDANYLWENKRLPEIPLTNRREYLTNLIAFSEISRYVLADTEEVDFPWIANELEDETYESTINSVRKGLIDIQPEDAVTAARIFYKALCMDPHNENKKIVQETLYPQLTADFENGIDGFRALYLQKMGQGNLSLD